MITTWMISLLFFTVAVIVLVSGIFAMQSNYKATANRLFFLLVTTITIWSSGMALATVASDAVSCEIFRRVSAIGWSTVYAILLHFILVITGKSSSFKKWWFYGCLYLPAIISLFAFAVPNTINPNPYDLHQTKWGWVNVPQNNVWDWFFYAYYIGYILIGLFLLYQWGKKTTDKSTKKESQILFNSIIAALVIGTITDVVLSSLISDLPQMAPIIMAIPLLSIYHILQKDSFSIKVGIDRKTSYMILFTSILIYIILAALQVLLSDNSFTIRSVVIDESVIRGVVVQIQMFLSVYLVLKENRPGYIAAVIMNFISLLSSIAFFIRHESTVSIPGIVSYVGVLVIISLINVYKEKNTAYIKRINTQAVREEFYSNIFKQSPVGIAIINDTEYAKSEELGDVNINPAYDRIVGRTKDELKSINWTNITHPDDLETDLLHLDQFKKGKVDYYSREKRYVKPDGSAAWVDMRISRFANPNQKPGDHVCIITDITDRKKTEATLKYNNEHVPLTDLYNRGVLENILQHDASTLSDEKRALVCINLSGMHALSLRYGNYYNQTMLKKIADSLKTFCSDYYLLFNTYEYHFVFYAKEYEDEKELAAFCENILKVLSSYLYIHGIVAGIGVLQIDKLITCDANELLKKLMNASDLAAKNNQDGDNIVFYTPELDLQITREHEISHEIREIADGLNTDKLYLQYQPIYDLASKKVYAFEALARLNSEKHGLIFPIEFIQIAEKTNMIVPFGEKIIIKALSFLNKLAKNGYDTIAVSINISTIQMLENGFADKLLSMITEMQINPENIGIELTESVFATERSEINDVINALKAARLKVLIDDFGTGYSSFSRERELNIDYLKIDKSFIDKLMELNPEEAITGDIISMAHKLGHCVVAEGVEHEKQLGYLRDHGCDRIQGYLISKPLNEEDALEFLKSKNKYDCHSNDSRD